MKLKRSYLLLLIPVLLLTQAFACSKHQAVIAEHDFKVGVQAAQNIEINEYKAGNIPQAFHVQFEQTILKVSQVGEQVSKDLAAGVSNATIATELTSIAASLQQLISEGAVGIKNPTTQTNVNTALQAAVALVQNLITALGGKI